MPGNFEFGNEKKSMNSAGSSLSSRRAISTKGHSMVLLEDGDVYSFGDGTFGSLGHGDNEDRLLPTKIETLSGVKAISAGRKHSLVLLEDGDVYSFGDGKFGALGHGDRENRLLPTKIETLSGVKAISAGGEYSLVLLENGDVYSFGHGNRGRLGHGDLKDRKVPTKIESLANAKRISAGERHSLVLLRNGDVYSFGGGEDFRLGQSDHKKRIVPTKIEGLTGVKEVSAGDSHSLVILENGDVYSFGDGRGGALGQGNEKKYRDPTRMANIAGASAIAAGKQVSIILLENGQVYSCGRALLGKLGHDDYNDQLVPKKIASISDAIAISTGFRLSMILLNNGRVYLSGYGLWDENEVRCIPTQLEGLPRVSGKKSNGMLVHGAGSKDDLLPPLSQLTFTEGKVITVGSLNVTIPDGIKFVSEDEDSKGELLEGILFQAVSEDYGKSTKAYQDTPIGINIRAMGSYPHMAHHLETEAKVDSLLRKTLNDTVKIEEFEDTYKLVKYQSNMAIAYEKAGEGDESDTDYWTSYTFLIFHESSLYSGMFYFNSLKASKAEHEQVLFDFLSRIMPGQQDAQNKGTSEKLGNHVDKKGRIDAIWATQLFSKDFVFYNDDEVGFDGTHHYMKGIQFNASRFYDEPVIKNNPQLIANCIADLITYVEKNENLTIPLEYIHDALADVSWNQPITGMSLFNLCAHHMINIRVSDTKDDLYVAVLDVNILRGIPEAYLYIAEFIKTLRDYNGIEGAFEVNYLISRVLEEDSESVQGSVKWAVSSTTDEVIKIDEGQEPYAGVIEGIA